MHIFHVTKYFISQQKTLPAAALLHGEAAGVVARRSSTAALRHGAARRGARAGAGARPARALAPRQPQGAAQAAR